MGDAKVTSTAELLAVELEDARAQIAELKRGAEAYRVISVQDLAARDQAEAALRESEERFRTMADCAPVLIWMSGLDMGCVYFNRVWLDFTGRTLAQELGNGWAEGVHPEDIARSMETYVGHFDRRQPFRMDYRLRRADGEFRWLTDSGVPRFDERGGFSGFIGSCIDITEHKRTEEALRTGEEKYRALFDSSRDAVMTLEPPSWRFTSGNLAAVAMFGTRDERHFTSLGPWDVSPERQPDGRLSAEKAAEMIATAMRAGAHLFEWTHQRAGGLPFPATVLLSRTEVGSEVFLQATVRDITEQVESEAQRVTLEGRLRQAEKMESVGRLAGGVAHDFNNTLAVVLSYSELALDRLDPTSELGQDLEEIRKAALRSTALTRQLLAFARKQSITPVVLDLNERIASILTMLRRLIGENVQLAWLPSANVWPVHMDTSQVDQVLINLCVNARDAISTVGTLTIETGNVTLDAEYCESHAGSVRGDYAQVTVRDDGCGMDKETQSHLFEPFFTTKAIGEGTGLGLASVYGAVTQSNGFIEVDSALGKGTTFTIYLPRHHGVTREAQTDGPALPPVYGRETILLVEDEPAILRVTTRMLEGLGYIVLAAATPTEAMRQVEEYPEAIHLLLTDVVMPEMSGSELAKNLLSRLPHLRHLFMSGFPADSTGRRGVLEELFLQKPFSKSELATRVREALGVPPAVVR